MELTLVDALILSHGHVDHYGSLHQVMRKTGGECSLYVNRFSPVSAASS